MKRPLVGIVDYGAGNVENVFRAFRALNTEAQLVSNGAEFSQFSHLVIPGVGAFNFGMDMIHERELAAPIHEFVQSGKPLLGICLGMHMLADFGHENGVRAGLGLIKGEVKRLTTLPNKPQSETIPHMGWDRTEPVAKSGTIIDLGEDYYFAHSFYFEVSNHFDLSSTFAWGETKVAAVIQSDNVTGAQFHPEKSGQQGLRLLNRFTSVR